MKLFLGKDINKIKPRLVVIHSTEGRVEVWIKLGFIDRIKRELQQYAKYFDVEFYTSDKKNYSSLLGVKHFNPPFLINKFGFRHIIFYLYLLIKSFNMSGVIKIISTSLPVAPLIKLFSRQKIIISYRYDWGVVTKKDYGGIKGLLSDKIQKLAISSADLVICSAEWLREKAEKVYNKRAIVIFNYVDTNLFHPALKKENFILFAGRLHWRKGVNHLIEAFIGIGKKCPEAWLYILGDGEERKRLEEKTKRHNLKHVKFFGNTAYSKVAYYMSKAKIFVLPTVTEEGHPKALIEAMASGAACIATNVPGNKHLIQDGENGLLVKPRDVESLTEAITLVLGDENLRIKLSENAHRTTEKFSIENTLQKEIELLREFTKNKNI